MVQNHVLDYIGEDAAASEDGIEIDALLEVLTNMSSPGKPIPVKQEIRPVAVHQDVNIASDEVMR